MKHVLAGTLAILATPALAMAQALDCKSFADNPGVVPGALAQQCQAGIPAIRTPLAKAIADETGTFAYGIQLASVAGFAEQGFYRLFLDDVGTPEPVNVEPGFANIYAMDFNPAATRLYGIQYLPGDSPHRVILIDTQTGKQVTEGFMNTFQNFVPRDQITGLTIDPRTGDAYVTSVNVLTNNPQLTEARLWRVNLHTMTPTAIANLLPDEPRVIFIDLAMDCDGNLFGHNISDDSLYRINPGDGTTQRIGGHGQDANFAQGMDFNNQDGKLYAALHTANGNSTFGRFNTETGSFEAMGATAAGQWELAFPNTCAPKVLDADALTGAWYAPYTSGQGFTARYFPASGDVFMPWFTAAIAQPDDGDDDDEEDVPNHLRWYVLFGQLEPGEDATELELAITQATDGSFDTPQAAPSQVVGHARLQMISCSQGVLEYDFDEGHNEGVSGRVAMTRLIPQGTPCTDYDGQVKPATGAYDPALTGSWYDPEAPGQGLELFRIARNEDAGVNGMLYGAWFTFAPEDAEDTGPLRQRWFTLDGQSVEENGDIKTTIVYTLGGTFDDEPAVGALSYGTATIKAEACNRLKFSYDFSDTAIVGEWRDRSGEITLYRLGPCPAQGD
ncbi:DUF6923 family protein [Pseudofulvimonas gallinarii]|jgi:hypothetical protein|uniref:DUF6923 domain-containing protein n=1 Tax=Pseudofulvimonas gallinarii TaxID=634155 RepID=A0A4V2UUX1_9GAMM|nr:hypothetical protein [Pseudofulvimonas gallinarii]TCS93527.1 hypothetical protein EDC25_12723 [Pseudofulvimonas gallinarii]